MKPFALLATAVIATQIIAAAAFADGVGAAPDSLAFSLTRDGSDTQSLVLITANEASASLALEVGGRAAPWITLSESDSNDPILTVETGANGRVILEVGVTVPSDAGNGTYSAVIRVLTTTDAVQVAVVVPVNIEVDGDAVISGHLVSAAIPPAIEEGADLRVVATVQNTGTVRVMPSVKLTLTDGTDVLATSSTHFDDLAPGSTVDLVATIPQAVPAGSTLDLDVAVRFGSTVIAQQAASIEVVELGSQPGMITHRSIELIQQADPGGVARLAATFTNDGIASASIMFSGAVTRDGEPVSSIESIRVHTAVGTTESVELFVPIEADGAYAISGRWEAAGVSSDPVTFDWTVGSQRPWLAITVLLGIAAVALAGLAWYNKSRTVETQHSEQPADVGTSTR